MFMNDTPLEKHPDSEHFLSHVNKLTEVIIEMKQVRMTVFKTLTGCKLNYGDYTSPVTAYGDKYPYDFHSIGGKEVLTVPGMLQLGIEKHQERVRILKLMSESALITASAHELLMEVAALRKDPRVAEYTNIRTQNPGCQLG